jgi:hypothetical protein
MFDQKIGTIAFILGVIIAIAAGLLAGALNTVLAGYVTLTLVVLGLIVGFLNIGDKDAKEFLIAVIALGTIGSANLSAIEFMDIGIYLSSMVLNVIAFIAPAALVVALKVIYSMSSSQSA